MFKDELTIQIRSVFGIEPCGYFHFYFYPCLLTRKTAVISAACRYTKAMLGKSIYKYSHSDVIWYLVNVPLKCNSINCNLKLKLKLGFIKLKLIHTVADVHVL